jgi:hypothetical protein
MFCGTVREAGAAEDQINPGIDRDREGEGARAQIENDVAHLRTSYDKNAGHKRAANVAVSTGPLGTVPDDQFVPVFQSLVPGLRSHVPLPAKMALSIETKSKVTVARSNDVCDFLKKLNLVFMLILHWPTATPQTLWARMLRKVRA